MKKLIIILLTVSTAVAFGQTKKSSSSFQRPYGIAGCGLGSVIVGKQGGQIFASTTNGTSFNQMFGISAGTLNCVDTPSAEVASRIDQFILVNRTQVQMDVARGSGETVSAIGAYMGCSADANVGAALKANYSDIFKKGYQPNEITDGILSVILDNKDLASGCKNLG